MASLEVSNRKHVSASGYTPILRRFRVQKILPKGRFATRPQQVSRYSLPREGNIFFLLFVSRGSFTEESSAYRTKATSKTSFGRVTALKHFEYIYCPSRAFEKQISLIDAYWKRRTCQMHRISRSETQSRFHYQSAIRGEWKIYYR